MTTTRARSGGVIHFPAAIILDSVSVIEPPPAETLDLPTVASLMGHSKFDMTLQVYGHPVIPVAREGAFMSRAAGALLSAETIADPSLLAIQHAATCANEGPTGLVH